MSTPKIYLDTSVWNFALAEDVPEHRETTEEFLEHALLLDWTLVYSDLVIQEIEEAADRRRKQLLDLVARVAPEREPVSEEAVVLATAYVEEGILTMTHWVDCLHVAVATVSKCDYLLSWNFRHQSHPNRSKRFLSVNARLGYNQKMRICAPTEVYEL